MCQRRHNIIIYISLLKEHYGCPDDGGSDVEDLGPSDDDEPQPIDDSALDVEHVAAPNGDDEPQQPIDNDDEWVTLRKEVVIGDADDDDIRDVAQSVTPILWCRPEHTRGYGPDAG